MKLSETVELMNSADYKDRFKAEYLQLKIRIDGLDRMLKKYKEGTLDFTPSCSYHLLYRQLQNMKHYAMCLRERAEIEKIELGDE